MEGLYMTNGVKEMIVKDSEFSHFTFRCLKRFLENDWGDMCEEDKQLNAEALTTGARLMGSYCYTDEITLWIIADAEDEEKKRIVTILLPEEY